MCEILRLFSVMILLLHLHFFLCSSTVPPSTSSPSWSSSPSFFRGFHSHFSSPCSLSAVITVRTSNSLTKSNITDAKFNRVGEGEEERRVTRGKREMSEGDGCHYTPFYNVFLFFGNRSTPSSSPPASPARAAGALGRDRAHSQPASNLVCRFLCVDYPVRFAAVLLHGFVSFRFFVLLLLVYLLLQQRFQAASTPLPAPSYFGM